MLDQLERCSTSYANSIVDRGLLPVPDITHGLALASQLYLMGNYQSLSQILLAFIGPLQLQQQSLVRLRTVACAVSTKNKAFQPYNYFRCESVSPRVHESAVCRMHQARKPNAPCTLFQHNDSVNSYHGVQQHAICRGDPPPKKKNGGHIKSAEMTRLKCLRQISQRLS